MWLAMETDLYRVEELFASLPKAKQPDRFASALYLLLRDSDPKLAERYRAQAERVTARLAENDIGG